MQSLIVFKHTQASSSSFLSDGVQGINGPTPVYNDHSGYQTGFAAIGGYNMAPPLQDEGVYEKA